MKKVTIKDIEEFKESRKNLLAFLHVSDIVELNELFNKWFRITDGVTFYDICDSLIKLKKEKKITNCDANKIIDIISFANRECRTERFRYDSACHTIYEFNELKDCYLFLQKGGLKDYRYLVGQHGKYID